MGFIQALGIASLALATGVTAAASSTGFTVSLDGIDYFLPPKAVGSISGEDIKALFEDGPFVPITVVAGNGTFDISSYSLDDVWQTGFLEGTRNFCISTKIH
jgi:hypothetical protein